MKKVINTSIHNWVNNNKDLLRYYKNKYIAYTLEQDIIAYGDDLEQLEHKIPKTIKNYSIYFVSPLFFKTRILPIRLRTVKTHDWEPLHDVQLSYLDQVISLPMLIDSGADCSLISYKTGLKLGLRVLETDELQEAYGIGIDAVSYYRKRISITIEGITIKIPVAWVQDDLCKDEIIGREVIFDAFDIEFKQADEQIIFKPRDNAA